MNGLHGLEVSQTFAQVLEDIAGQPDFDQQLSRFVELAQKTVGFGEAAVWTVKSSGDLALDACTNASLAATLTSLRQLVPHPVQQCFELQCVVEIDSFATELRWPTFSAEFLENTPVRSGIAFYLGTPARPVGVLMLFATEPGVYVGESKELASTYAVLAGQAIDAAALAEKARNLQLALATNRRIGMAIGVIMALHRVDEASAFSMLRRSSQELHRKVRDVAETVILTGALSSP
jgi:transcriptional regulator with GAF, ATPase, and Fis domain